MHDAVGLRKEAMAADINTVSLVTDGSRDAPHHVALLEDERHYIRASQQLARGSQARRSGADDYGRTIRRAEAGRGAHKLIVAKDGASNSSRLPRSEISQAG